MEEQWEATQMSQGKNKSKPKEQKIPQGLGAESSGMFLQLHKEELERGVFVNSNKSPILAVKQHVVGPNPMPFSHFRHTGLIPQEVPSAY